MKRPVIDETIHNLKLNNFEVYKTADRQEARELFFAEIFSRLRPETVSRGDSYPVGRTEIIFTGKESGW